MRNPRARSFHLVRYHVAIDVERGGLAKTGIAYLVGIESPLQS
jgi:hypothetical protein